MSARTVFYTAPQGTGKTLRAEALRKRYGCTSVVDDWWPGEPIQPGALHLTNEDAARIRAAAPSARIVVGLGDTDYTGPPAELAWPQSKKGSAA